MSTRNNLVRRRGKTSHRIKQVTPNPGVIKRRRGPKNSISKSKKEIIYDPAPTPRNKYAIVVKSHARQLAKDIGYDVCQYKVHHMAVYDGVIFLGPYYSKMLRTLDQFHAKYPNKHIILWWVGSDVLAATKPGYDVKMAKRVAHKHFCVSKGLQDELHTLGINAEIVTLVPDISAYKIRTLPEKYTIGLYMPHNNPRTSILYRWIDCRNVISQTPDINYIIYGNKNDIPDAPKNAKVVGWVDDTSSVLKKCNCLLRLTQHDGFPKGVIEATLMGRAVICNHDYPHVIRANTVAEVIKAIRERPKIGSDVVEFYKTQYTKERIKQRVDAAWRK